MRKQNKVVEADGYDEESNINKIMKRMNTRRKRTVRNLKPDMLGTKWRQSGK